MTFFLFTSLLIINLILDSVVSVFQKINKYAFVMNDRITFGPTTAPSRETEVKKSAVVDVISFLLLRL